MTIHDTVLTITIGPDLCDLENDIWDALTGYLVEADGEEVLVESVFANDDEATVLRFIPHTEGCVSGAMRSVPVSSIRSIHVY